MDGLQAAVLRALCQKDIWLRFNDLITDESFTNTNARALYGHLRGLHEVRAERDVGLDSLSLDIEASYIGGRKDELLDIVQRLGGIDVGETCEIEPIIRKFVSREELSRLSQYIASHLDTGVDLDVAMRHLNRAVEAEGSSMGTAVDLLHVPLGEDYAIRPNLCSTGVSRKLDAALDGGVGGGELLLFLAPPSRGKTSFLVACGTANAMAGKFVYHISLEISRMKTVCRYDQALTHMKKVELRQVPSMVRGARNRMAAAGGMVWIQNMAARDNVTAMDIRASVRSLERAVHRPVDLLIIDYLELVKPTSGSREAQRFNYGNVGIQMRALAQLQNIPIATAWQVKREDSKIHVIDETSASESWEIIKHADIIIGENQSREELRNRIMRVNIIKQRESQDRPLFYLDCDLDRMNIRDQEDAEVPAKEAQHVPAVVREGPVDPAEGLPAMESGD